MCCVFCSNIFHLLTVLFKRNCEKHTIKKYVYRTLINKQSIFYIRRQGKHKVNRDNSVSLQITDSDVLPSPRRIGYFFISCFSVYMYVSNITENGWPDFYDIFQDRFDKIQRKITRLFRLTRLFRAPQTKSGRDLRSWNAYCRWYGIVFWTEINGCAFAARVLYRNTLYVVVH